MSTPLRPGDPKQIGPYRLHGRLGSGGMGRVYLGHSPGGHTVAVKVVHPDLADDPGFRTRFIAEVAAARKVGGFYTAQVAAADTAADPPWLATAYIPGPSLFEAVEKHGPLPTESVAALGAGLAEGLATIHACDIVHRDLKPANVLLATDGPRVIDFGIARALDTTSHTRTRTVVGTAGFIAPEQVRGGEIGPACDVFALGCVLGYAATGRNPFGTGPIDAVVYRVVHEEPDLAGIPQDLASLIAECLDKKADRRPGLDDVLHRLAPLAGPAAEFTDGGWLPSDVTEIITERRTRVYTQAVPKEPKEKAAPKKPPTQKSAPKKAAPKKPPTQKSAPKKATYSPKPERKPESANKASAPSTSTQKSDNNESGGTFKVLAIGAAIVAVICYVSVPEFALWVSQGLNDGTDEMQVGNCAADIPGTGIVEVPCWSAASQYTASKPSSLSLPNGTTMLTCEGRRSIDLNGEKTCLVPAEDSDS